MEYGFSVLMFCFAGMLLLYAGLLALTKDISLIPRMHGVKVKNRREYAVRFAKAMAVAALDPLLGGVVALFHPGYAAVTMIVGLAACIWIGVQLVRDTNADE